MAMAGQPSPDQREDLDELTHKLDSFHQGLKNAWKAIEDLEDNLAAEREQRRELEAENEELRQRINDLDARTDLLNLVEKADEMSGKQRSVALIQHLRRAAERQADRGNKAKSSVNREGAEAALQYPSVDRTTLYDDMRRAARLVGNKHVLWYESASGGDSRLKLNLEAGDLPTGIVGAAGNNGGE